MSNSVDTDYVLTVTVRIYGGGSADEAAEALRGVAGTFFLSGDREVEILDVAATRNPQPTRIVADHPGYTG
jgi:hypothetical protein